MNATTPRRTYNHGDIADFAEGLTLRIAALNGDISVDGELDAVTAQLIAMLTEAASR